MLNKVNFVKIVNIIIAVGCLAVSSNASENLECSVYFPANKDDLTEVVEIPQTGRAIIQTHSYIGPVITQKSLDEYRAWSKDPKKWKSSGPQWTLDEETMCRVGKLDEKIGVEKIFPRAVETIDALGHGVKAEAPKDPTSDNYRLKSHIDIRTKCSTEKTIFGNQFISYFSLMDTRWYGSEGPLQGTEGPIWTEVHEHYGIVFFRWMTSGRPNFLVEPAFSWLVKNRQNKNIWHLGSGYVECRDGKALMSYRLYSSNFPSLRNWIATENQIPTPNPKLAEEELIDYSHKLNWKLQISKQQGPFAELFKLAPPPETPDVPKDADLIDRNMNGAFEFKRVFVNHRR